ncbi:MAG TPA: helix-turn-helix domain-containing protein [Candidatus Dormibacteraeota bacterium]|nr:helix-turn-helix domain-containing protein [Candidatus Dormibacteraeota bacterium]
MLQREQLAAIDGITVTDVRCGGAHAWSAAEQSTSFGVVLVRAGLFRRRVDGVESIVDPTVAYFERPHQEQQVSHPTDGGDRCTAVALTPDAITRLLAEREQLLAGIVHVDAAVDLEHRLLITACRRRAAPWVITERVVRLLLGVLDAAAPERRRARRTKTQSAHRAVVDGVRQALLADPAVGLVPLATMLHVSPAHLSRIFHEQMGMSVSRFRTRLRVGLALERLAGGEDNLAALAADLGFADHSHLGRVVRQELGQVPSALRAALAARG